MPTTLLTARSIGKRYEALRALDEVDFSLAAGQVHALIGENGAGKSTLLKILYRLEQQDDGTVELDGKPLPPSTRAAQAGGVRMVQQHFALVPEMTALENVLIGQPTLPVVLPLGDARRRLRELGEEYGLHVDPDVPVEQISIGERQRVELLRALWEPGRILLLDEPTAVLAPREIEQLFSVLDRLRKAGLAICIVTHKVGEMKAIADQITVLHRGRNAGQFAPSASVDEIARAIVGGAPPPPLVDDRSKAAGAAPSLRLQVRGVVIDGPRGNRAVNRLDLEVHAGEIVGIAGVEGNGQSELGEWLAGLRPRRAGTLAIDGRPQLDDTVVARRDAGCAYIPEDRHRFALLPDSSVADNVYLYNLSAPDARRRLPALTATLLDRYDVQPRDADALAGRLSGGNQQKLVVGRTLHGAPTVLIAAQPTRGVDLGAQRRIHQALLERRDEGAAILLFSADLDELLQLASRVLVLYRGVVVKQLDNRAEAQRDHLRRQIGEAMMGMA